MINLHFKLLYILQKLFVSD